MNYKEKKDYIRKIEVKLTKAKDEKEGFVEIAEGLEDERSVLFKGIADMTKTRLEINSAKDKIFQINQELGSNQDKWIRRIKQIKLLEGDLKRADKY